MGRGRYATPSFSFPFFVPPPSILPVPESSLIHPSACILGSPSSHFPPRSPLSSPPCLAKETRWHVRPPTFPGIFLDLPVLRFSEFPGFLGFVRFIELSVLRCAALHCVILNCFCISLYCDVLHCIAMRFIALPLQWLHSFRCFALLRIELYGCVLVGDFVAGLPTFLLRLQSCSSYLLVNTPVQL